ncbi:hypothetical protein QL093DRAFT_2564114 [Fusarium oxysporum]|nr:hypothetical protein QL093DRAFT_2564114 [Fusarium oxysporum]
MATAAVLNGAINGFNNRESDLSRVAVESAPAENPRLTLVDRFVDEPRPLRVGVIGAGLAGITAGILLPAKVPGIKLTIYEKNADVAGTWFENVYPGVRCDIASHVYQSTFAPKTDWSDKYAPGHEIREYWQSVAQKFDVYKYVKLNTRVEGTTWDDEEGVWITKLRNVKTGEETVEKNEFILTSIGRFNDWKLPDYPGISEYKGHLRHASNWSTDFDPKDKTVAVIGNGASGIQVTANLQPIVKRLDHYARNKTWIAVSWAGEERKIEAQPYTEEEKKKWAEDPDAYLAFRKDLESLYWTRFDSFFRNSESNQKLREAFIDIMKKRLVKKPELLEHIVPDFSPNCRRLTPGPGYLEAITEDNVEYIRTRIKRFTETGIETEDGKQRDVDAVICATGANVDMVPAFPIRAHGQELSNLWKADGTYGYPYTYFGLGTPGFPNLLFVHGPQATGPSGTVPHSVETQLTYFAKVLRKVSRQGIKSLSPSKQAADDFVEYSDAFFAKTVLTDKCSSWYNVLGLCNLSAPGIWVAMNSLGAGGAASPKLINAANALTFCLMVVSCYFSSAMVRYIGIKGALIFGTLGYAPYAAGLYTNNRFGTEWLVLVGAALCGISAGVFWMAEAAIAIAYPEPWNRGKALGYWLTYRLSGQILGGAINLGLNADRNEAGKVSYTVYLIFIALQAVGPFVALLLSKPHQVQRKDGVTVKLEIDKLPSFELKETARLFFTKKFLLVVLFIGQAVFAESVFFTYLALWFSVRSRALGSFLGGIVAVTAGNILGAWLDRTKVSLRFRTRSSFAFLATLQGACWIWATVLVTRFRETRPTYDWVDSGFGHSFAIFLFLTLSFQLNYLFLYFVIHHLANTQDEIIRFSALLRGTESAWQALSYGITSLPLFAEVGGVYFNFALWGLSIFPAWLVLKDFGSHAAPSLESPIQEVDSQNFGSNSGEDSDIKKH